MDWTRVLSLVFLGLIWVSCVAFIVHYTLAGFKWWKNPIGWMLITMSASVGAFALWYFVILLGFPIPGRVVIRTTLFILLTASVVGRYVMFVRFVRIIRKDSNVRRIKEVEPDA